MRFLVFSQTLAEQVKILRPSMLPKMSRIVIAVLVLLAATMLPPAVYAEEAVHVVKRGESLGIIARYYNISTRELMNGNGINNPDFVYVGQRLVIPGLEVEINKNATAQTPATKFLPNGDGYYITQRGDTLSQIAKDNGLSLAELMRLNGLMNENYIWVGQQLRLTARVAAVALTKPVKPQLAIIHIFKAGDTLAELAAEHRTTVEALLRSNGLPHEKFVWVGQRLRIQPGLLPSGVKVNPTAAPADGRRWIEVNLSEQTLTAWQGDVAVMHTYISSGRSPTPTVTGRFKIGQKYSSQRMVGPDYDLPGVPWVMYFYGGYAIHGAYWHNNFGTPMSHGCVNMTPGESQILYNWAPAGTEVYVHY